MGNVGPPIVIDEVVRYAVRGTISGRPWVNVFDVEINEGRPAANDPINKVATALLDGYATKIAPGLSNQWQVNDVRWVDLNSANGTTGIMNDTAANNFPKVGGIASESVAANCAILAIKSTVSGRGQRNGRTYFPGLPELYHTNSQIDTPQLATINTRLAEFLALINSAGAPVATPMVVAGFDKLGNMHVNAVTSYQAPALLATQRRRLRP